MVAAFIPFLIAPGNTSAVPAITLSGTIVALVSGVVLAALTLGCSLIALLDASNTLSAGTRDNALEGAVVVAALIPFLIAPGMTARSFQLA